jgi:hypothetical protein
MRHGAKVGRCRSMSKHNPLLLLSFFLLLPAVMEQAKHSNAFLATLALLLLMMSVLSAYLFLQMMQTRFKIGAGLSIAGIAALWYFSDVVNPLLLPSVVSTVIGLLAIDFVIGVSSIHNVVRLHQHMTDLHESIRAEKITMEDEVANGVHDPVETDFVIQELLAKKNIAQQEAHVMRGDIRASYRFAEKSIAMRFAKPLTRMVVGPEDFDYFSKRCFNAL